MSVSRAEAARLARACLPKLLEHQTQTNGGDKKSSASAVGLSEKDITVKSVCRLWAGMGYIYEVTARLPSGSKHPFIVKHVTPPSKNSRSLGDRRKADSYVIEANFYEHVAPSLVDDHGLSIPIPYHVERDESSDEVTICMSKLEGSPGYVSSADQARAVLTWLATLHAATWGSRVDEYVEEGWVQPIGSYWHLDTRPDEHDSMPRRGWEGRLRLAARAIDERLRRDGMQCCVHGDAKEANILFQGGGVSMYDFQYCGKAPPSVSAQFGGCKMLASFDYPFSHDSRWLSGACNIMPGRFGVLFVRGGGRHGQRVRAVLPPAAAR